MRALLFIFLLVTLSLLLRIQNKRRSRPYEAELPEHAKVSPLSDALQELIATAGGIYLSLVLLVSFLQMDLADHWLILDMEMDPLAFISLLFSFVQPLFFQLIHKIKGGT